ncbi:MAG: glycosyltransferase family A protein [Acidobacteriota bacterium]
MQLVHQRQHTQPRLSVVIMMRNEAATIGWTLDSLHRQELDEPFEVIFVDGASDDGTIETIVEHPLSERVDTTIAVLPPENSGMCVAQNVGAELARGAILLFMQADLRVRSPRGLADTMRCFDDPDVLGTTFVGLGPDELFDRYDFWGQVFMSRYVGDRVEKDFDLKFNAVRSDVFEQIGGFDEERLPLGGNDFDFEHRLRDFGDATGGVVAESRVEVEHLHALGKPHTPAGLFKKYCRNSEVAGATAALYHRYRRRVPGYWSRVVQQWGLVLLCVVSLVPLTWPLAPLLVVAGGFWWNRKAYRYVRDPRLILVPAFSVAALYAFAWYFTAGVVRGKTLYEFDNRMR